MCHTLLSHILERYVSDIIGLVSNMLCGKARTWRSDKTEG